MSVCSVIPTVVGSHKERADIEVLANVDGAFIPLMAVQVRDKTVTPVVFTNFPREVNSWL